MLSPVANNEYTLFHQSARVLLSINYLLTYDSYVPLYSRFHRGEWITRVSGGEGALDTPGPLECHLTVVLYCDGDFNWLGQVLEGGGGEI
jgi:hypothetical protein